jgi:hypothetical protein
MVEMHGDADIVIGRLEDEPVLCLFMANGYPQSAASHTVIGSGMRLDVKMEAMQDVSSLTAPMAKTGGEQVFATPCSNGWNGAGSGLAGFGPGWSRFYSRTRQTHWRFRPRANVQCRLKHLSHNHVRTIPHRSNPGEKWFEKTWAEFCLRFSVNVESKSHQRRIA